MGGTSKNVEKLQARGQSLRLRKLWRNCCELLLCEAKESLVSLCGLCSFSSAVFSPTRGRLFLRRRSLFLSASSFSWARSTGDMRFQIHLGGWGYPRRRYSEPHKGIWKLIAPSRRLKDGDDLFYLNIHAQAKDAADLFYLKYPRQEQQRFRTYESLITYK